jgi:hypothetical protein
MDISEDVLYSTLAQMSQKELSEANKKFKQDQKAFEVVKNDTIEPIAKIDILTLLEKSVLELLLLYGHLEVEFENVFIQFDENGVTPNIAFLLIGLGMASMSGFFTIREGGLLEKIKSNTPKTPDNSGKQEPNKIDISKPFIEIVFPKVLVLANNNEFIDFLMSDFHPQNQNPMPQNVRQAIDIVLDGVNKNTSKGDVRLANIINLLFNVGLIAGLASVFMPHDQKNTPIIVAELIAETISSFPDDHCYFSNKSIISFDPNVCDIPKTPEKIEAQKAVACPIQPAVGCPAPPVCDKNTNNTGLFMVCGILALLAFTFFFLYMTAKPKVIRVPMRLSDTEGE